MLQFVELSDRDRRPVRCLPVARGDTVEVRVLRSGGGQETVPLPPRAAELIGAILERLSRGERVAVLAGDQELTPNEAAAILGMSRPLVVHRMEIRDLPFRDVGKHRRVKLKDVLALKQRIDETQAAVDALAEGT